MKYGNILACGIAFCIAAGIFSDVRAADVFDSNRKRIDEITRAILSEIERQQNDFKKKLEEQSNPSQNGMDPYGAPGPMPPPGMSSGMGPGSPEPAAKKVERFELDKEAIKKALRSRFRYDYDKNIVAGADVSSVDTRSEIEIREEILQEMAMEWRSQAELLAEDQAKCEEQYPLYKQGTNVDISFAVGNEPPRRYRGTFKRISPYRIQIGRNMMSLNDLPEIIRCRFDEALNKKMRADYMKRRPITTKYNLERQTELAARSKQVLEEQMKKNLSKGWVYINDAWKLPEDMIDDVLDFRKRVHKQQFNAPKMLESWAVPGN